MAEKEIEDSSEGIFAKLKLCCPFHLSEEVNSTFTGLCRIQEEKAGVSSLFMEVQLQSLLHEGEALGELTSVLLASPTGPTATVRKNLWFPPWSLKNLLE